MKLTKTLAVIFLTIALSCASPTTVPCGSNVDTVFFGDSITHRQLGVNMSYAHRYASERMLGKTLIHAADGRSASQFLPGGQVYDQAQLQVNRPATLYILLGTNDALGRRPVESFKADIQAITRKAIEDGVGRVVIIIPPKVFRSGLERANPFLTDYVAAIQEICAEPDDKIECGPNLFELMDAGHFRDGVHPDISGYKVMYNALWVNR